jgi:quinol-cytochrome oxidoreductase complex cytochrome b subunit
MRLIRLGYFKTASEHLSKYPAPLNLNYFWGYGSLSFFYLAIQIVSGLLLAMYYTPHVDMAFDSVQHIMREVNYGWLIRYIHSTGSSMFFAVVYVHIGRGLYYGSYLYPRGLVWCSGVIIFLLMMATAFLGYVLPWGQMSFWAATVITNLFSAIPAVGENITQWLWGGFSVDNPTLKRFFVLHFFLPFVILGVVIVHLILLHKVGSGNPLGIDLVEVVPFYPYFIIKDFTFFFFSMIIFTICVCWYPNLFIHPDNYIRANPMVTPAHIVPEWYFLPFYAMLRAIPDKLGGVVVMVFSILILLFLPLLGSTSTLRSSDFRPFYKFFFWYLVFSFLLLGWLGACPVEEPYIFLSRLLTFYYFLFFLFLMPLLGLLETYLLKAALHNHISNSLSNGIKNNKNKIKTFNKNVKYSFKVGFLSTRYNYHKRI